MLVLLFALSFGGGPVQLSPEHQAINFMIGYWRTESVWPATGERVKGTLRYEWVVAGHWMKFTFQGEHPTRPYWEAHGFIQWTGEHYISTAIWGPDGPHSSTGTLLGERGVRFESGAGADRSGIDYLKRDGAVFQENWRIDARGQRIVTLQTTYTAIE